MPSSNVIAFQESVSLVETSFLVEPMHAPRLLVSVRNPEEARAAIAGGCDILDIKEPDLGSLGMADPTVITRIIRAVGNSHADLPISAALGEVLDWRFNDGQFHSVAVANPFEHFNASALADCKLLKIGCAGLGANSKWRNTWNETRNKITASMANPPNWVAVAYADWEAAQAPRVSEIVQAALQDNCCGVLLDTFTKSNRWLLDWIPLDELQSIADQVHSQGVFLALAGSLSSNNLTRLKPVEVDVLAIRGAACVQGRRQSDVAESAVKGFKRHIADVWNATT